MDVPTEAAAAYLEQDRRAAAALSFRRWAASNARIGIPHMPERDAFLKHLETIRASLREKRAVCRLMETAETQFGRAETAQEGFRLLLQGAAEHAHLAETLAPIGDTATALLFKAKVAEAPRRWVTASLEKIHSLILSGKLPLEAVEAELSQALEEWRRAGILPADADMVARCRKAAVEMAKARLADTRARVDERCALRNYMAAVAVLERELDRLQSGAPETGCYLFFDDGALLTQLQEETKACFQRHVPDAFHNYQVAQDAALNVDNRFSLAMTYDEFATGLAAFMGGSNGTQLPSAVREALGRAHRNAAQARQMQARLNKGVRLPVAAQGMSAEEAAQAVRAELHGWGVADFFQVTAVSGTGEGEPLLLHAAVEDGPVSQDGKRRRRAACTLRLMVDGREHVVRQSLEREVAVPKDAASDGVEDEAASAAAGAALRGEAVRAAMANLQRPMAQALPAQLEQRGEAFAASGRPLDAAEMLSTARAMAAAFPVPQEEFRARLYRRIAVLVSLDPASSF